MFQITRTSGGTVLSSQPTGPVLSTPVTPQVLVSMPIPALAYHQSIQLSTVIQGRAIFQCVGGPCPGGQRGSSSPSPDANLANDSQTVDNLIRRTLPVNTSTLGLFPVIGNAVQNAHVRLDANNAMISIPGVINTSFKIPGETVSDPTWASPRSLTPTTSTTWSRPAPSTPVTRTGGWRSRWSFANNSGRPAHRCNEFFPDLSVQNLKVKIDLPLTYNAQYQYFLAGNAQCDRHRRLERERAPRARCSTCSCPTSTRRSATRFRA